MLLLLADSGIMEYLHNPLILIVPCLLILYFLYMRPQAQKQKELESWIANLSKGEEVITSGGIWGKIYEAEKGNPYVVVELQEKVRVRLLRSYVAGKPPEIKTAPSKENKEDKKEKEDKKS